MSLQASLSRLLCGALLLTGLAALPERASAAGVNLLKNGGFETGVSLLIMSMVDAPSTGGNKTFSFNAIAASATTLLSFQFRDDPGFMLLDAVQVIPEPASLALVSVAVLGVVASRRRKTQ